MTRDAQDTPAWLGEFGPDGLEQGELQPRTRESAPDGMPLWPTEPITVSYVKPARDEPTEARIDPTDRAPEASGPGDHDAGFAPLGRFGLVAVTGRRPVRPPAAPRPAARRPRESTTAGLVALILLGLLSAFFAWVTAEPLWLALGHSTPGTVTVTRCVDHGLNRRCAGTFTSADGRFTRTGVPVMGEVPAVSGGEAAPVSGGGTAPVGPVAAEAVGAPAVMTSAGGARAYVNVDPASRAAVGVALILLCGLAIVRATGVRRLPAGRPRGVATALSLAGPLTLLAAMLALTY
jgi:hypothetical protein